MTHEHPLDNPVRSSLAGPHARFARRRGAAACYPAGVSPFAGMPDQPVAADWDDLAALAGPGALVALASPRVAPPDGWDLRPFGEGVQLIDAGIRARGQTAFLHATADNAAAIRLYERMGFRLRATTAFWAVRVPAGELRRP